MILDYPPPESSKVGHAANEPEAREKISTVSCECGNHELLVNLLPYPYIGCYLKVTCPRCGKDEVLFDDYS